jgi:hypothetical protein
MARAAAEADPVEARFHRRNLGEDQHDAALWPGQMWPSPGRCSAAWALENNNLHRRAALRRFNRPARHRWCRQWRTVPGLRRAGPVQQAAAAFVELFAAGAAVEPAVAVGGTGQGSAWKQVECQRRGCASAAPKQRSSRTLCTASSHSHHFRRTKGPVWPDQRRGASADGTVRHGLCAPPLARPRSPHQ